VGGGRGTPVGTSDDGDVAEGTGFCSDAEIGEFYESFFCCEDVGTLDVSMDDTLEMEVIESL